MSHRSLITAIVIDVPNDRHADEVAFWGGATGSELVQLSHAEYHGARLHPSLVLLVQQVGDGAPRVHIDVHADDIEAEVARLMSLGASERARFDEWVVLSDPAGLPFCVVQAPAGALDSGPAVEWP